MSVELEDVMRGDRLGGVVYRSNYVPPVIKRILPPNLR
jgi:hypothetical protein